MALKEFTLEGMRYMGVEDSCQVKFRTHMVIHHTCVVHVKVGKHVDLLARGIAPWIAGSNPVAVLSKSAL